MLPRLIMRFSAAVNLGAPSNFHKKFVAVVLVLNQHTFGFMVWALKRNIGWKPYWFVNFYIEVLLVT